MSSTTSVAERGRLPAARRDRRAGLAALALLLVVLGALGSALIVFRSGDRQAVVVAAHNIRFGEVVSRADFSTARAATDQGSLLDASKIDEVLGTRATSQIPAGSLVSPQMFTTQTLVPNGGEAVGIVLSPNQLPSEPPAPGQVVRIYFVQGGNDNGAKIPPSNPIVRAARVLDVGAGDGAGTRSITVLVSSARAADVTDYASSGNLALTILPDSTTPDIDWKNE